MTWTLFSLSKAFSRVEATPHPDLSPAGRGREEAGPGGLALLADPFHVALDGNLAHLDDFAVLDLDEPRSVSRPMVLAGIGEGRGEAPRVELLEALEGVLHRLARRVWPGALDRF